MSIIIFYRVTVFFISFNNNVAMPFMFYLLPIQPYFYRMTFFEVQCTAFDKFSLVSRTKLQEKVWRRAEAAQETLIGCCYPYQLLHASVCLLAAPTNLTHSLSYYLSYSLSQANACLLDSLRYWNNQKHNIGRKLKRYSYIFPIPKA